MKRVAITGDRDWGEDRYSEVYAPLSRLPSGSFVVLGDARGVDSLARRACKALGMVEGRDFVVKEANWDRYHRAAGAIRNGEMLDELEQGPADAEREVWWFNDDLERSKGTKNCVDQARRRGLVIRCAGLALNDGTPQLTLDVRS